jgi:hypothetical protein
MFAASRDNSDPNVANIGDVGIESNRILGSYFGFYDGCPDRCFQRQFDGDVISVLEFQFTKICRHVLSSLYKSAFFIGIHSYVRIGVKTFRGSLLLIPPEMFF